MAEDFNPIIEEGESVKVKKDSGFLNWFMGKKKEKLIDGPVQTKEVIQQPVKNKPESDTQPVAGSKKWKYIAIVAIIFMAIIIIVLVKYGKTIFLDLL